MRRIHRHINPGELGREPGSVLLESFSTDSHDTTWRQVLSCPWHVLILSCVLVTVSSRGISNFPSWTSTHIWLHMSINGLGFRRHQKEAQRRRSSWAFCSTFQNILQITFAATIVTWSAKPMVAVVLHWGRSWWSTRYFSGLKSAQFDRLRCTITVLQSQLYVTERHTALPSQIYNQFSDGDRRTWRFQFEHYWEKTLQSELKIFMLKKFGKLWCLNRHSSVLTWSWKVPQSGCLLHLKVTCADLRRKYLISTATLQLTLIFIWIQSWKWKF